jgi:GcrA cell cycle regulator
VVEEDPVILDDGHFATVLTINDRMCRWPIGDPAENEFHFLRPQAEDRFAVLRGACAQGYQPQPQRRDRRQRRH